jgi:uncharacterized membrane protein YccC
VSLNGSAARRVISTARAWLRAEWAPATRATIAVVLPLGLAVAAGDLGAGLTMSLGAFAALYARREPYRRRAVLVAAVGLGLVAAAGLGTVATGSAWTAGLAIAVVGAVATWAAQSTDLGPPGAYMLTLVTAVSTHLGGPVGERVAYVALGAAVAWLVVMSGALVRPAAPQRNRLAAAYDALAALLRAPGPSTRHAAAVALRIAGDDLVAAGPGSRDARTLRTLHGRARKDFLRAAHGATVDGDPSAVARALRRGGPLPYSPAPSSADAGEHFTASSQWHLGPHSLAVPAGVRVFVAAVLAAAIAAVIGLPHAYWAPAAAVVVLQATSARLTVSRAVHRVIGTVAGVLIAAGIFALEPSPVLVVVAVGVLQFLAEVTIGRMYALGVAFVTPLALLIAESAGARGPLGPLLADRLTETVLGCAAGILVAVLVLPRAATHRVPVAVEHVRRRGAELEALLSAGRGSRVVSAGRGDGGRAADGVAEARRELVRALTSLTEAVRNAKGELRPPRDRDVAALAEAGEVADEGWLAVTRPRDGQTD